MSSEVLEQMVDDLWAHTPSSRCCSSSASPRSGTRRRVAEGWDVADVVLHRAETNELAIASATGRFAEVANDFAASIAESGDVEAVRSVDDAEPGLRVVC